MHFHPELQGNALANVFGQVGMFLSPYIVYSATLHETLPFAILAVASFAGAGISALLPETARGGGLHAPRGIVHARPMIFPIPAEGIYIGSGAIHSFPRPSPWAAPSPPPNSSIPPPTS